MCGARGARAAVVVAVVVVVVVVVVVLTCSCCHTQLHRSFSGLTRGAAATLAGFANVVQRLRHNSGKDHCRPTGLQANPPSQPSASSNGMQVGFFPKSTSSDKRLQLEKIGILPTRETKTYL